MRQAIANRHKNATCKKCLDRGTLDDNTFCRCEKGQSLERFHAHQHKLMVDSKFRVLVDEGIDPEITPLRWIDAIKDKDNIIAVRAIEDVLAGKRRGVMLQGLTGTGKTFLASLAAIEFCHLSNEPGEKAHFLYVPRFIQTLFNASPADLQGIYQAPFLVLDDLGKEPLTAREQAMLETENDQPFSVAGITALIDERERRHLPTIITTNLKSSQLRYRYRDYVFGRLYKMCQNFILVDGDDRRMPGSTNQSFS